MDKSAAAGESPYDLVLLDMMLNEDMDGLQVFHKIRHKFPAQRAIIVSGNAPTARVELAIAEGAGWLAKPYTPEMLASAVHEVLSRPSEDSPQRPSVTATCSVTSSPPL